MNKTKFIVIKLFIFAVALIYLIGDLYVWHGAVARQFDRSCATLRVPNDDSSPVRTEVFGEGITENQLARRTAELALLIGKKDPRQIATMRGNARTDLIRSAILRIKARYNDREFPNLRSEAQLEVAREASRFDSPAIFKAALKSQGYTEDVWIDRIETRLKESFMLSRATEPAVRVSDEDVLTAYNQVKDELIVPASRVCRQIFLASLDKSPDVLKEQADIIIRKLQNGEDFATLAQQFSEDENSKQCGGNLGQIFDSARRPLKDLPLFDETVVPNGRPVILQSRWGLHLILAEPILPARTATFEESEDSLRSALLNARRELAVRTYFNTLLREGFFKKTIRNHDQ